MSKITEMTKYEKPREKLYKYGPEKLKDYELLAILLRTGTKECDVLSFAKKILKSCKDKSISAMNAAELCKIHGVGLAKACEIVACFELGKRLIHGKKTALLLSPEDVWSRMVDIRGSKKEHLVAFYLDSRNQEIKREIVSIGTLNENLIHPREVFESAIKNNAASIIIAHNHPSGDTQPSAEDLYVTKRLVDAGRLLDIEIQDHVIVSNTDWRSILNQI